MKYVMGLNVLKNPSDALNRKSGFKYTSTDCHRTEIGTTAINWHMMHKLLSWQLAQIYVGAIMKRNCNLYSLLVCQVC
jgi:hypothetical protein